MISNSLWQGIAWDIVLLILFVIFTFQIHVHVNWLPHNIYIFILLKVGAALRPAFAVDTPADVTAMACEVRLREIYWIECSRVMLVLGSSSERER